MSENEILGNKLDELLEAYEASAKMNASELRHSLAVRLSQC